MSLEEPAEGAHNADQQQGGTQTANGKPGVRLLLEHRQLAAEQGHQQRTHKTQGQGKGAGGAIDLADLVVMAQSGGFGNHTAYGHRQTGDRNGHQDGVNLISGVEITETLLTDDGIQRNFVQRANDFYQRRCHGQQDGAVEE